MKITHKYAILAIVSFLTICLFIGNFDSNVDTEYIMPVENNDLMLYTSDDNITIIEEDPPDENTTVSVELIDTVITFNTNTSAEDQSKISWGYSEWREHIILQNYNVTEAELEDSILTNETFQNNIHISTIMAWGQYNGSLSEEELRDLYNQMEHQSVVFVSAGYYESSDERLDLRARIKVKSNAWLAQYYEARYLDIKFWSSESTGKWHNYLLYFIRDYTQMAHHSLWWTDPNPWDGSSKTRSVYSDILTGSKENNLYVKFRVSCIYNGIPYTINKYYYTHLVDDDTRGPSIYTAYHGSYTDGNPGFVNAWGYDASGGTFTTPSIYLVPNSLGIHSYTFRAVDYDNDRPGDTMTSSKTVIIPIYDDDITPPVIGVTYIGSKTDDDPGIWRVYVSDPESSVAQVSVKIDGVTKGTTAGDYAVPNTVGSHTIQVFAINNDLDRGFVDQEASVKNYFVTIAYTPPTDPIVDAGLDQTIDEGSIATFIGSFTDTGVGETYTYNWDFGDGTIIYDAGTLTPTHEYIDDGTYTVTLTVFDDDGGIGTDTLVVTVNNIAPTVEVEPDQTINEGSTASFSGSFEDPGEDDTYEYQWDFGDGTIIYNAGTLTPSHTYFDNGTYTVTLTVFDNSGGFGTDTLVVTVNNVAPTAEAGFDLTVDEGETVVFGGSFTDPGEYDTHEYQWDFGDGHNATGTLTPSHEYGDNGVYTVTLTVFDNSGDFDTDTLVVTVNNVAPTVDAGFDLTVDEGETVVFGGDFDDPGEDDTHTYDWDFGDGHTATGTLTPSHEYGDNGDYTVTLTVTDDDGGFSSDTLIVTVNNVAPVVDAGLDLTVDEDLPFTLSGSFTDPGWLDTHTFEWDFGDGTIISDTFTPTHTYDDPGEYIVTLTVWDDEGGQGSDTLTITVLDKTPPVTSIAFELYYEDEFGNIYITSDTFFTLDVIEEFSGIAWTKYTINGEEFDYTAPFNIIRPDGTYVITFNSMDTSGNVEVIDEDNEITVILVSLDINSYLTDSEFNPVTYFDFIFRKDKLLGYTLVATNPGQFYYHIEVQNTWLTTIDLLSIEINLPQEFITQGATPIHVYLDGIDITESCEISGTTVIVSNVPSGSLVYITIHMDFGLKGDSFESLDDFILGTYSFDTTISGDGILTGTYGSSSFLIGQQKKSTGICGFVTDVNGDPRPGVIVSLYSENGFVKTTITDENGFYYFIDLELPTYYLKIGPIDNPIFTIEVTVKKDDFIEVNYSY